MWPYLLLFWECAAFITFTGWPTIPPFTPAGQLPLNCLAPPISFPAGLYFRQSCVANRCVNTVRFTLTPDLRSYGVTFDAAANMVFDMNSLGWSQLVVQTEIWATDQELPDGYGNLSLPITCELGFPSGVGEIQNQIVYEGRQFWYNVSSNYVNKARLNIVWVTPMQGLPPNSQISFVDGIMSGMITSAEALVNGRDRTAPIVVFAEARRVGTSNIVRSNEFTLTVIPLEGLRFARFIPQLYANESLDFAYNLNSHFSNPNGFGVTWTSSHPLVRVNAQGVLEVTAADSLTILLQPISVIINGTDERFHVATSNSFTMSVTPRPPIVKVPNLLPDGMCGVACSWNPADFVTNPSGNPMTFRVRGGLPFGSSLRLSSNGTFYGTPTMVDVRASPITLILDVSNGILIQVPFSFRVLTLAPPALITSIPERTVRIDQNFSFSVLSSFNLPTQANTFTMNSAPSALQIDSQGNMFGIFSMDDYTRRPTVQGTVTVNNVNVCGGGLATSGFVIRLDPDIQAPMINVTTFPPTLLGCQGDAIKIDFSQYFVETRGLALVYSITGLLNGTGLSFDASSGVLVGKPNAFDVDSVTIMIIVCAANSAKSACLPRVSIPFARGKLPPVADPPIPSPVTALQGDRFIGYFNFHFYDPNMQPLIYSVAGLPPGSGMGIGPITGIFSGSPNEADYRASPLVLSVFATNEHNPTTNSGLCKGSGGRARADFILTVQKRPLPPVCQLIPPGVAQLGQYFTLDVSSSFSPGKDGDRIEFALRGLPRGSSLTIDSLSGVISGFVNQVDLVNPPLTLVVAVTNGYGECQSTLLINGLPPIPLQPCPVSPQSIVTQNAQPGNFFSLDLSNFFVAYQRIPTTYGLAGLPQGSGFSFETQKGILSGTPSPADISQGSLRLTLEARCGSQGQPVASQFTLVITQQCSACQNNGGCQQTCFVQSPKVCLPTCGCNSGLILGPDQRSCQPGNPCDFNNGGCEKICTATNNQVSCSCPPNWLLASNGRSCNYDPCGFSNGNCEQLCISSGQQARCDCRTGALNSDGKTCASDLIAVGTIPPALVVGCQMFVFDFATAFQLNGANKAISFAAAGLPLATGLTLTKKGLLSGSPSAADCAVAQPMTLSVEARAGNSVAHAVMFISAFCDGDLSACKSAPSPKIPIPSAPSPMIPIPVAWATVCVDFELELGPYFRQISDTPRFGILGLPSGSGLSITPSGKLRGKPTSEDCAAAPLALTISCSDSQRREFKGILNLKFRSCECQMPKPIVIRVPIPVRVPLPVNIDRPVKVPVPRNIEVRVPVAKNVLVQVEVRVPVTKTVPGVPVPIPVAVKVPIPGLPVPVPGPAVRVPVQVPVTVPGPAVRVPVPVTVPGPAVRVPVPMTVPGAAVRVPVPVTVPGPAVRVPVPMTVPGPAVRVPVSVTVPGPAVRVPVQVPVTVPGPAVRVPVQVPVTVPGPAVRVPVQVPVTVPGPAVRVPVQVPVTVQGPAMPVTVQGPAVRVPVPGATVRVPVPGESVRVPVPGATVRVPAPGATVRVPVPGAPVSVNVRVPVPVPGPAVRIPVPVQVPLPTSIPIQPLITAPVTVPTVPYVAPLSLSASTPATASTDLHVSTKAQCGQPFFYNTADLFKVNDLKCSVRGLPPGTGIKLSENGVFSGAPNSIDATTVNPLRAEVTGVDRYGAAVSIVVFIEVQGTCFNLPPLASSGSKSPAYTRSISNARSPIDDNTGLLPVQVASANQSFALNVSRISFCGVCVPRVPVQYQVLGLPKGTGLALVNGALVGTPSESDCAALPRPLPIKVQASQNNISIAEATIHMLMCSQPIKGSPILNGALMQATGSIGSLFFYNAAPHMSAVDSVISFAVAGLPFGSNLKMSPDGVLSGVLSNADVKAPPILISASDSHGNTVQATLSITVHATKDTSAPVFLPSKTLDLLTGKYFSLNVANRFYAESGGPLTFEARGLVNASGIKFDSIGLISGVPNQFDAQEYQPLRVTIIARKNSSGTEGTFYLNINGGANSTVAYDRALSNQAPISTPILRQVATEGVPFLMGVSSSFFDPDGDLLKYRLAGLPSGSGLQIDPDNGVLSGTPRTVDCEAVQPLVLTVTAADSQDETAEMFLLTVFHSEKPLNQAPVASFIPNAEARVGQPVLLRLSFSFADPDGDNLNYTIAGLPIGSGLSLEPSAGILKGTPSMVDLRASPLILQVNASDLQETAQATFTLTVTPMSQINSPPLSIPMPPITVSAGMMLNYNVMKYFSDPDLDPLTFQVYGLSATSGFKLVDGMLTGVPSVADLNAKQPMRVGFLVYDSRGGKVGSILLMTVVQASEYRSYGVKLDEDNINVTVSTGGVPQLGFALGKWGSFQAVRYFSSFASRSLDEVKVRFELAGLPNGTGLSINQDTGVISGIPTGRDAAAADSFSHDGKLLPVIIRGVFSNSTTKDIVNQTMLLNFESGGNRAPFARSIRPVSVNQGETLRFAVSSSFSDPDGDRLTYTVTGLPLGSGFSMVSGSGVLFGTASLADANAEQPLLLTIVADDGRGEKAQEILFVTVVPASFLPSGAKSCQELGWPTQTLQACAQTPKPSGRCLQSSTFQEAKSTCESLGARLCSAQELTEGVVYDSGECNAGSDRFWSSSSCGFMNPPAVLTAGGPGSFKNVTRNCTPISLRQAKMKCCADSAVPVSQRKCDELSDFRFSPSDTNRTVCTLVGGCMPNNTLSQARDFCQSLGARLCTSNELVQDVARGSPCGLDKKRVWTATECGIGKVLSQGTVSSALRELPPQCTAATEKRAFHCCADVNAGTDFQDFKVISEKGILRLSWIWPAYPLAQLSIQKQLATKVPALRSWVTPTGGELINLVGNTEFVLKQLQPGAKYTIRITPIKRTPTGTVVFAGQAVQVSVSSTVA